MKVRGRASVGGAEWGGDGGAVWPQQHLQICQIVTIHDKAWKPSVQASTGCRFIVLKKHKTANTSKLSRLHNLQSPDVAAPCSNPNILFCINSLKHHLELSGVTFCSCHPERNTRASGAKLRSDVRPTLKLLAANVTLAHILSCCCRGPESPQ